MDHLQELYNTLPPILARQSVGKFTGGIIQPGTCANLDSRGLGPEGRFRVGKKICYSREAFLKWLEGRIMPPKTINNDARNKS